MHGAWKPYAWWCHASPGGIGHNPLPPSTPKAMHHIPTETGEVVIPPELEADVAQFHYAPARRVGDFVYRTPETILTTHGTSANAASATGMDNSCVHSEKSITQKRVAMFIIHRLHPLYE